MFKILLVEDNEVSALMLRRRLTKRGYVVFVAVDGLQALELVGSECPDLVLMDLSLPELDGLEATRRIKSDPLTAAVPVIALTAHAFATHRDESLAAGCDEFETKPVDFDRLLAKMDALLGGPTSVLAPASAPILE